jgi:hypothetical protein
MLYHVHHVLDGVDKVRESLASYDTAKRLALDLVKAYGGRSYVTQAGLTVWDSLAAAGVDRDR